MTAPAKPKKSFAKSISDAWAQWAEPESQEAPPVAIAPPAPGQRKAKPSRPIDYLKPFWPDREERLLAVTPSQRDLFDADAVAPYADQEKAPAIPSAHDMVRPVRPAPRGPEAIVRYLARRGVTLHASADGAFYAQAEGGRLDETTRRAITAAGPLLRPFLHGSPATCALPHGEGERPPAVTVLVGGALACSEHAGG